VWVTGFESRRQLPEHFDPSSRIDARVGFSPAVEKVDDLRLFSDRSLVMKPQIMRSRNTTSPAPARRAQTADPILARPADTRLPRTTARAMARTTPEVSRA
jgi:hypothetical protein